MYHKSSTLSTALQTNMFHEKIHAKAVVRLTSLLCHIVTKFRTKRYGEL